MIADEFDIWDGPVPVIILNDAPIQTKEFQIWTDEFVPYVDIYDNVIPPRRRVFIF